MPKEIKTEFGTTYEYKPVNPIPKSGGIGLGVFGPAFFLFWIGVLTVLYLTGLLDLILEAMLR